MIRRILNNVIALFVVIVVLFLFIPLPPQILDILLVFNIGLSIMILMITMNIAEALDFSIFPSLLLITTLFRLGMNVSSTRMILTTGNPGVVIQNFGQLVTGGNIVVGFVIFFIIVLVQLIVITKGAERVSEVAARFTLDAMPGKQMAIDADLSSGLIDEQQARMRREKIQKEADFYGAMDGATKIVKGDSTMSIIITVINLVGGIIIGVVVNGGDIGTVMNTYCILTIGDGLVSQIPSLMISTATGMIVTRSVSDGSLNVDVTTQFTRQPRAITTTGVILVILAVIPNTPTVPLFIGGAALLGGGMFLSRQMTAAQQAAIAAEQAPQEAAPELAAPSENDYYRDINNVYSLLSVEPVEMEFGYSLIPMVDERHGGKLTSRIVIFRRQYAQDMGLVIPSIKLRDSSALSTNEYCIRIKGEEVARGEILIDYFLALDPENPEKVIDGIETVEPAYGIPSRWIRPEDREKAELYGYTVIDPLSVMVTHLSEVIRQHAFELLTRQEVVHLVENTKKAAPELIEEAFPNLLSYGLFQRILTSLLKEGVPIKDMETIIETLIDTLQETGLPVKDIDSLIERIRVALKRTITRMYCEDGSMKVITLDGELERTMAGSIARGEGGYYMALSPDMIQSLIRQLAEQLRKFNGFTQNPVVLTSQVMRVHFYRLVEPFYPNIRVLSFNEIASNVQIQSVGSLRMENAGVRQGQG